MSKPTEDVLTEVSKRLNEFGEMKSTLIDFLDQNLPDTSGLSVNEVMLQDMKWQQSGARAEEKHLKTKLLESLEGVRKMLREAECGATNEQRQTVRFLLSQSYFIEGDLQWLYVVTNSDRGCSFPRDPAITAFKQALRALGDPPIQPDAASMIQDSLGRALQSDGKFGEAIAAFQAAMTLAPGSKAAADAAEEIAKAEASRERAERAPSPEQAIADIQGGKSEIFPRMVIMLLLLAAGLLAWVFVI